MPGFARIWPSGLVDGVSTIDASELVQLDIDHMKAPNFVDGDTKAPSAPVVVGGAGMTIAVTDPPTFVVAKILTVTRPPVIAHLGSGWAASSFPGLSGPATNAVTALALNGMVDGATLTTIDVLFSVATVAHTPANFPSLEVVRQELTVGIDPVATQLDLSTSPNQAAGAYAGSNGSLQLLRYTANQNNVIDNSKYLYYLKLTDEWGSSSVSGNLYVGVKLGYTAIGDMRL